MAIMYRMNDLERFDLATEDFMGLDWESMQALLDQTDCWRARARLRARWLLRSKLDALPDFSFDQLASALAPSPADIARHEAHISDVHDTFANDWK